MITTTGAPAADRPTTGGKQPRNPVGGKGQPRSNTGGKDISMMGRVPVRHSRKPEPKLANPSHLKEVCRMANIQQMEREAFSMFCKKYLTMLTQIHMGALTFMQHGKVKTLSPKHLWRSLEMAGMTKFMRASEATLELGSLLRNAPEAPKRKSKKPSKK